jgi:hypothetical protein
MSAPDSSLSFVQAEQAPSTQRNQRAAKRNAHVLRRSREAAVVCKRSYKCGMPYSAISVRPLGSTFQEPKTRLWCQRLGYAWQRADKTKCKIQRLVSLRQPKRQGFAQAGQRLTRCCLTLHSSGPPTALRASRQALGLRPILRLPSAAQRRRGPLNSNVRQHTARHPAICTLRHFRS